MGVDDFRWELFRPRLQLPSIPYHGLLRHTVDRFPEKIATVFRSQKLTFREIDGLSNSLGRALSDLRVTKGDRVALFMTNRPEYLISFEAAAKIGAAITPLNPVYREAEAEYQLGNSEARVVIVHEDKLPVIEAIRAKLPAIKHVILVGSNRRPDTLNFYDLVRGTSAEQLPPVELDVAQDLIALPYSSGTTGLPKGVMLTHRNLVANAIQAAAAGRITERDTLLIFLPFYHIYGTMLMGKAVAAGATQVIMERFDPLTSLALIHEHRVTVLYAVPPVLLALANLPDLKKHDLSSLRYMMSGAAPLPPEVGRRVQELTGVTVLQGYGLTEASPLTHLSPVDNPELIRLESIGWGVSEQEDKIVDIETGKQDLGVDQTGELVVRGPQVMKGYWKAADETARALRDGWLFTGDIARKDKDGFVYILDRKKEMIKYKGFGVAPAELEALLHEHPAVADCAVVSQPDEEAGEIPKAFIVLNKGASATATDLMRFVEGRVAGYKRIRAVEFIDEIPKNPSGKILRRLLKQRGQGQPTSVD
ncbi:MAG: class I adenylate-forming enzyme family protein [Candidatus Binatia bacterium]